MVVVDMAAPRKTVNMRCKCRLLASSLTFQECMHYLCVLASTVCVCEFVRVRVCVCVYIYMCVCVCGDKGGRDIQRYPERFRWFTIFLSRLQHVVFPPKLLGLCAKPLQPVVQVEMLDMQLVQDLFCERQTGYTQEEQSRPSHLSMTSENRDAKPPLQTYT